MRKLIILQSITPDYRKLFFETIQFNLKDKFRLYSGDSYFESSLKDDESIKKIKVKNFFLFNKFLIQSHFIKLIFENAILVLEMNPRILTNWVLLIFRKFLKKETVLWGHAWPRKGKESKSDLLRGLMRKLSSKIIVYTNKQKEELKLKMPNKIILAAPNAVIPSTKMISNTDLSNINNIIYVGRLTKLKKTLILIKAFHGVLQKLPKECDLVILGSGDEVNSLKEYVSENSLKDRVHIKGHVSSYVELKKEYLSSLISVSPGYVGLSITQSFGFGVPMIISKNENHSPEIEAFEENKNGLYYETDNVNDLGIKILNIFENKKKWIDERKKILDSCKENYSIDAMANTFIKLIN